MKGEKVIEKDLDKEIKLLEDNIIAYTERVNQLKTLKENPMVFMLSDKYNVPVDKVMAIASELQHTMKSPVEVKAKIAKPSDYGEILLKDSGMHLPVKRGITIKEQIKSIFKQNPCKWFTSREVTEFLPDIDKSTLFTQISQLAIYDGFLNRRVCKRVGSEDAHAKYEYTLKRKPRKPGEKGKRGKLISFLKSKAQFWHTSKGISEETAMDNNYVSGAINMLVNKGMVAREFDHYPILMHGNQSKIPAYRYKWKG